MVQNNITLAALNLIPLPLLDGSRILMALHQRGFNISLYPWSLTVIIIGFLYLGIFDPLVAFSRGIIAVLIGILLP